jgi:hypothetical protein
MSGLNAPSFASLVAGCLLLVSQAPLAGNAPASQLPPAHSSSTAMPLTAPIAADCIPAWVIDAAGIRRLPDRCIETTPATAHIEVAVPPENDRCEPPWFIDSKGKQRIRSECLESNPSQASTAAGPAVAPRARSEDRNTADCDRQPHWIDANGIRRLRQQCL